MQPTAACCSSGLAGAEICAGKSNPRRPRPKPAGRRFGEQRRLSGHPVEGKQCGSNRCWLLSPSSIHTIYERTRLLEASLGASKTGVHTIAAQRHDAKEVSCFRQVRVPHDAMIMQNARGLLLRYFERCHCRSPASAWGQVKAGGRKPQRAGSTFAGADSRA